MKTESDQRTQMSEAFITVAFLSLSGGLQDAYTYLNRGGVFANAQTGNIVLLSVNLLEGNAGKVFHYLVPLLFFALGVMASEMIRTRFENCRVLHWRQIVAAVEIVLLFLVGLIPPETAMLANALVSFSCAMQVQAFRKVDGFGFASTMCIGNMRSGVEAVYQWKRTGDRGFLSKAGRYFGVILLFACGAGFGGVAVEKLGSRTIWLSCLLLLVCFLLMFRPDKKKE